MSETELREQVRALERTVAGMQATIERLERGSEPSAPGPPDTSTAVASPTHASEAIGRRRMLLGLGAAGAGAAAGVAAGAAPASAAAGDPLVMGQFNTSAVATTVSHSGSGESSLDVLTSNSGASWAQRVRRGVGHSGVSLLATHGGQTGAVVRADATATGSLSNAAVDAVNRGGGAAITATRENASGNGLPAVLVTDMGSRGGVEAFSTSGVGVRCSGGSAPLRLDPSATAVPASGSHSIGEIRIAPNGTTVICTTMGSPGLWSRVMTAQPRYDNNAVGSIGYAGAVNLMTTPFRLFDSRPGQGAPLGGGGKLVVNTNLTVQVGDTPPSGGGPPVPFTAVGVLCTITVTGTEGAGGGFLKAFPTGVAVPDTSVVNWFGVNQNLATTTIVRLDSSGRMTLRAGSARTHAIIDVIGFLS